MFFKKEKLPFEVKRQYKKSDWLRQKIDKAKFERKGYYVYSEEEVKQFSGGKALGLGLIFLPLALLGSTKYILITYRLREEMK